MNNENLAKYSKLRKLYNIFASDIVDAGFSIEECGKITKSIFKEIQRLENQLSAEDILKQNIKDLKESLNKDFGYDVKTVNIKGMAE